MTEKPSWEGNVHEDCTIVGFGKTDQGTTGTLYHAIHNPVLPPEKCQAKHPKYQLNDHFVCIFHDVSGICSGDSGGPLLCDNKVYGLATMELSLGRNCTDAKESYFLLVEHNAAWINEKMEGSINHHSHQKLIVVTILMLLLLVSVVVLKIYFRKKCSNLVNLDYKRLGPARPRS